MRGAGLSSSIARLRVLVSECSPVGNGVVRVASWCHCAWELLHQKLKYLVEKGSWLVRGCCLLCGADSVRGGSARLVLCDVILPYGALWILP